VNEVHIFWHESLHPLDPFTQANPSSFVPSQSLSSPSHISSDGVQQGWVLHDLVFPHPSLWVPPPHDAEHDPHEGVHTEHTPPVHEEPVLE